MIIEPGTYTYETMPDYTDDVPSATEVACTRDEVGLVYTPNVVYASPCGHDLTPMLLLHGTKDKTVFCQESVNLYQSLWAAGKDAELVLLRGAEHGDTAFWREDLIERYDTFLKRCLR